MNFVFKPEDIRFSKKIEEKEKENHIQKLNSEVRDGKEGYFLSYPEIEKTREDREMISTIKQWILEKKKELSLELNEKDFCVADHIHFVDAPKGYTAYYSLEEKSIEINGHISGIQRYAHLCHEMLHLFSINRVYVSKENNEIFYKIRTGYALSDTLDEFNEAITERITREILEKNHDVLHEKLKGQSVRKELKNDYTYLEFRKTLNQIIRVVAREENFSEDEIWKDIQRGYFTGEMMHLRKIEKVYGKGFLRFLSNLSNELSQRDINFDFFIESLSLPRKIREIIQKKS